MSELITISKDDFQSMLQQAVQKGIQVERGRMTDMWIDEFDFRQEFKNPNNGKPLSKATLNQWIVKYDFTVSQIGDRRKILRSSVERALKENIVFSKLKKSA